MEESYNISSILGAISELHNKKRSEVVFRKEASNQLKDQVPVITDNIIKEAEEFKKNKSTQVNSQNPILNKQKLNKINSNNIILNEANLEVIKNLQLRIKELENNQEFHQSKSQQETYSKKKIIFKKTEEKLRLKIIDLEQDITIFTNKENISLEADNLRILYKQVKEQKQKFIELKDYSLKLMDVGQKLLSERKSLINSIKKVEEEFSAYKNKANRDLTFYKENYEKLIIEKNNIKERLSIAKEQISNNDNNKTELSSAVDHLNVLITKTKIAGKISPIKTSHDKKSTGKSSTSNELLETYHRKI
jgi:hypothetical protein